MNEMVIVSVSPHIHAKESTQTIMRDVLIALCPAVVASALFFGFRALLVEAVCVAACVFLEWLYEKGCKRPLTVGDLSAAVTGLILALNLPPSIPIWMCVVGSAAAIISCYCALSVIWSRVFLKEKLSWKHYAAILVAFLGIVTLGFFDA